MLIVIFILVEISYDRFHTHANRIYRVASVLTLGGKPFDIATTNYPPTVAMKQDYPEVENAVRFRKFPKAPVQFGEKLFYEDRIFFADSTVFQVFTFPMLHGDPRTALTRANSIVLTEATARKYFGTKNPVGRNLRINEKEDFEITGNSNRSCPGWLINTWEIQ